MMELTKRFYAKVRKTSNFIDCWIWEGCTDRDGYGKITIRYKKYRAHRLSWIVNNGAIPDGLFVLHKCDNPPCCNPKHLFLGTQLDNMRDKWVKNRQPEKSGVWGKKYIGSKNGQSRLTEKDVIKIRSLYKNGMAQKDIAVKFSVGETTIWSIVHRKYWTHI